MATYEQTEAAQNAASKLFADCDNVAAIGISKIDEDFVLRVNLERPQAGLPDEILGVPVSFRVVGPLSTRR